LRKILLVFILVPNLLLADDVDPMYPTSNPELVERTKTSTEVWEYPLPFFAQDVIDMGFDLPYPFGISVIYAGFHQELRLDELHVGLNGGDKQDLDGFVSLDNSFVENQSVQVKADAWIFPFLNVFGLVGAVDGDAELEIVLDCSPGNPMPLLCAILPGQFPTFPVRDLKYRAYTASVGATLAAGWDEWFLALPVTYVWSDVDILSNTVQTFNFTPRIGYSFDVKNGNFYPYFGATYLDLDMTIVDSIQINGISIDYSIRQQNRDTWNALAGFNWDISKHWSLMMEVGFWGSRDNIISGVTYRY